MDFIYKYTYHIYNAAINIAAGSPQVNQAKTQECSPVPTWPQRFMTLGTPCRHSMRMRSSQRCLSPLSGPLPCHRVSSICQSMADNNSQDMYWSAGSCSDHTRIVLFTPSSAPVQPSVDSLQVARFFNDPERYKLEITSRQAKVSLLPAMPYTAIIDHSLLNKLIFKLISGEIDTKAASKTWTSEQIKEWLLELLQNRSTPHDSRRVVEALEGLDFPCDITDPAARKMTYCADMIAHLDAVGYGCFKF